MERSVSQQAPAEGAELTPWIFGLHDPGSWQEIFQDAAKTGWVMFNQVVDDELAARGNPDLARWSERGFDVLTRLVNAPYDAAGQGRGSIPLPEEYEAFARRCAEFVRNSPGGRIWFVGNEMNVEWHWPWRGDSRAEAITPDQYANCFHQVYAAIKDVQPDAWVIPSGVNPLRKPGVNHEDGLRWFEAMVRQLREMDGYDIHAYFPWGNGPRRESTEHYNYATIRTLLQQAFTPEELTRFVQSHGALQPIIYDFGPKFSFNDMIDATIKYCQDNHLVTELLSAVKEYNPHQYEKYEKQLVLPASSQESTPRQSTEYYLFSQFLELIPPDRRELPVFITESTPPAPWPEESDGWMQRTYAQVNRWNHNPGHQAIYALLPYRWGEGSSTGDWSLAGKPSYHNDLRQALQYDYRWRVEPGRRFGDPLDRAAALNRVRLVEPQGAGVSETLERSGSAVTLLNVPADAYVLATDTNLEIGFTEQQRIMQHSLQSTFKQEGELWARFREGFRSQTNDSDLLQEMKSLAPVPLGQAAAVEAGVFGARHLILAPMREEDTSITQIGNTLTTAVEAALALADRLGDVQRIALPAIATGELQFATEAGIVLPAVVAHLQAGSRLQEVAIVPDDEGQYQAYRLALALGGAGEPPGERQFWLVTGKPENWARAFQAGKVAWTEVRGGKAQQNLQQACPGDVVLAYRSTPDRFIAGLGHVVRGPYPYQDRHAVDIELDLALDQGVTLDELRRAVPELEHVTGVRLSFSRVQTAEWTVIRELIRYHNPDLAPGNLPAPTAPPRHRVEVDEVTLSDAIRAGEPVQAGLRLRNRGNTTWAAGERLHVACHWWPAREGQAEGPAVTWDWTPALDRAVPPGGPLELADLDPQVAPGEGQYQVHLTVSGLDWEANVEAAEARVTRTVAAASESGAGPEPTEARPDYRARITLLDPPPDTLWPGETTAPGVPRLEVENLGARDWAVKGSGEVLLDHTITADRPRFEPIGEMLPLRAPVPSGESVVIEVPFTAPIAPGAYHIAWGLSYHSGGKAPGYEAMLVDDRQAVSFRVMSPDEGREWLASALAAPSPEERKQSLARIGRVLEAAPEAEVREVLIAEGLYNALFDADWTVGRAALYTLYRTRQGDDGLDAWLETRFAAKERDLAPVRELARKRLRREEKEWLQSLLPPEETAARYAIEIEQIEPAEVEAGQVLRPILRLRNRGSATWQADQRIMGTLAWLPPEGITLPDSELGFSPQAFEAEVGPGEAVALTMPEIEAPPEPGLYRFECYVRALDWEASAQRTVQVEITPPTAEYDAALRFQVPPPAEAWPGEKIQVEFLVENSDAEPWPATGPTAVRLLYRQGSSTLVHRLPALAPGESLPYAATYTLPDQPGGYELTWHLVQGGGAAGEGGEPLGPPLRAELAVLDLAQMDLPTLVDKDAQGLLPEVRGRRLQEIGRRLQAGAVVDEAQRQEIVEREMAPALFSSSAAVRAAALQALHDLSEQDAEIDQLLHDSLDKPDEQLDPIASSAAAISAQVKDWLDSYLPESLRGRVGPPIIVPAQPPAQKTEAVSLSIRPAEVELEYDGKSFKSKNLLDDAGLSQARADRKPPRLYGELLFEGLFNREQTGGSGSTYDGYVQIKDEGNWHLELQIDPTVPAYRWEYLCNKYDQAAQPLSVYQQRPLFRRIDNNRPVDAAQADPLRILVAICNPITLREKETIDAGADEGIAALARLDVAQERAIIQSGLARLQEAGLAGYEILESQTTGVPVTLDALIRELKNGYHVLHLLAHGLLHNGIFWLVMENDKREHSWVRAEEFESALTDYGLRLVVLASCQSALPGGAGGAFPGLGALLIKRGIPAVVAMQDNVSVESAQIFTQRFYDDLARTGRIDTAMAATRYDLYRYNRRRWDWGIPVLFMNNWDGRLFSVKDERLQEAPPSLAFEDLEIKSYDELPGEGDPTARALANAVQAQVRAVRDDPGMLTAMRSLIAAQAGPVSARKAPPLAPQQERKALDELAYQVRIDAGELARFVKSETDMEIPLEVYQQVASALNAGKHVVLTGAPGTGKTSLSHAICQYACRYRPDAGGKPRRFCAGMTFTTATADWTTFDTIGGYVPTEQQTLEFRPGIFLEAVANGHWLVIDEINRAEIDKAFGELFTVLSGQQVDLPYKVDNVPVRILPAAPPPRGQEPGPLYWARHARTGYDYVMTPSWRIIGTMNVYDKSYLFNMSFAFMRRFAFVDIDLPQADLYHALVRRWFDRYGLPVQDDPADDSAGLQELTATLHALIQAGTPLMTRRALGPAIVKDMAEYIGDRYATDGRQDPMLLCYLGEAFQLYALPQLDGLDHEGILEVYAHVHHLFRGLARYDERPGMLPLLLARIGLLYPHVQVDEWDRALREWKAKHPGTGDAGGPIVEGEAGGG
jgi:MoxR-like ATPase/predicted RNA-binding protein with PUA-like domain/O-acetyl-ADP-ribose deacetylase (regulator of RNase III)